jgi:hypothetical protein
VSRPWPSRRQRGRVWHGKLGRSSCAAARLSGQEQRGADPTRGAGLTAGSVRFHRRVCMQGNRPRASRLVAVGVGVEREWRTGAATRHGGPAGGCAGMPAVHAQEQSGRRGFLLM